MQILLVRVALLALLLGARPALAAGEFRLVEGNVSVVNGKGEMRIPARGERIEAGETVMTGRGGEAHVETDDSGFLAVRENTRLKIEAYRARGGADDSVLLRLLRGTFRSVTGWIGRNQPASYAVVTPTATIGIRGTDHEPLVIDEGPEAGTYDKVNSGGTRLDTPFGKVDIAPGQAGFVPKRGAQPPKVLAAVPPVFKPSPREELIDQAKPRVEKAADEKLKERQRENEKKGGGRTGAPKVGDAEEGRKAQAALDELLRAYERGDTLGLGNRLNPAMIGYQKFLDDVLRETNQCKQMRVHLLDTQVQAGPDVAVIQTSWQKRCLLLPNFAPQLTTGQATFLMHRGAAGWSMAALSGNNPFTGAGVLATLQASYGGLACSALPAANSTQPFAITVVDPDRAGSSGVTVSLSSAAGDRELLTLPAADSYGTFRLSTVAFSPRGSAMTPGNGKLDIFACAAAERALTILYADSTTPSGTQSISASVTIPPF